MISDQQYFRPRCDERTYEEAIERATYLVDGGFYTLTSGQTFDQFVQHIAEMLLKQKSENV